ARGITIQIAHVEYETANRHYAHIDCPGHADYVKNMITGTSQADAAVLVVASKAGANILQEQPQVKEHAFLAKVMGVNQLIVGLNKMDEANYSEAKYKEAQETMLKMLKSIGYKEDQLKFVPYSAWEGENVVKQSGKMSWYKGPTLVQALDELKAPPLPTDKPLRLPIQDVYNIKGVGTVPVGRVETGIMKPGDKIIIMPSGKTGEVKTIEAHHEQLPQAVPGDNIGFNVRGLEKKDVARGDVVGHQSNPPTVAKEFEAQIVVLSHPTAIPVGYTPVFHLHTAQVSCSITQILKKIDPKTGATVEENPKFLKTGDAAIVKITPLKPLACEEYSKFPQLGRFAIRDMGATVAAGIILKITPR
ncbi:MAG: translation elongation factor EF-1 subunit alpha, partial [Candidatus Diapherotrites archaeon]